MVYIAIGFVASNIYDSDALGIKLFLVPIVIAPAYLSAGYLAWTSSAVLLGLYENPRSRQDVLYQAFVASFPMVMWDLTMDPISSTDKHLWIWHDGQLLWSSDIQLQGLVLVRGHDLLSVFGLHRRQHGGEPVR
jgi:putative membrane protein